jgi:hypothetical protein
MQYKEFDILWERADQISKNREAMYKQQVAEYRGLQMYNTSVEQSLEKANRTLRLNIDASISSANVMADHDEGVEDSDMEDEGYGDQTGHKEKSSGHHIDEDLGSGDFSRDVHVGRMQD